MDSNFFTEQVICSNDFLSDIAKQLNANCTPSKINITF